MNTISSPVSSVRVTRPCSSLQRLSYSLKWSISLKEQILRFTQVGLHVIMARSPSRREVAQYCHYGIEPAHFHESWPCCGHSSSDGRSHVICPAQETYPAVCFPMVLSARFRWTSSVWLPHRWGSSGVDLLEVAEFDIPRRYGLICTMGYAGGGTIPDALNRTETSCRH